MANYSGTDNLEVMADAINYNRFLISLVLSHAKMGDKILDVGAGIGTFSRELVNLGYQVQCIEPDQNQAAIIAAAGLSVSTTIDGIADGSIDYLYTLNVLEHIGDDVGELEMWRKKLKPGGRILIYVPAFQVLFSSMDKKVGHLRRYTKRDLVAKLNCSKYEVVTTRYADSLGFFASLLFRILGNSSGDINRRTLITYDRVVFPLSHLCDRVLGSFCGKNIFAVAQRGIEHSR